MRILMLMPFPRSFQGESYYDEISAILAQWVSPGTEIELGFPEPYEGADIADHVVGRKSANGIHHVMAVPAHIRRILAAEQEGFDAVIESNTFDPAVEEARLVARIPVIGLLRTSMHFALTLSDRVGITVPFMNHVPHTWRLLRNYGLDGFVSDIRPLDRYIGGEGGPEELQNHTIEVMRQLVRETRTESIVPLGGLLIPYAVDPRVLTEHVGVPVFNTKLIGIRAAEACVNMGVSQSNVAYPKDDIPLEAFGAGLAGASVE